MSKKIKISDRTYIDSSYLGRIIEINFITFEKLLRKSVRYVYTETEELDKPYDIYENKCKRKFYACPARKDR